MGDVVDIKPTRLDENHGFVADCCRYQEGILTEANMKLKYGFADSVWERLGDDRALLEAVEDEKIRRIRTGQQKREIAQGLIVKAPTILDSIMSDVSASPRHRVDAIKTLDGLAANPQENTPAASGLFQITINLGADHVEHYSKSIAVDPNDGDPNDGEGAPQRALPAVNKPWDSDDVVAAPIHTGYKPIKQKPAAPDTQNTAPATHRQPDYEPDRQTVARAKLPLKTGENGKAKAAPVKAVKKPEQQTVRLVACKSPEELALESLLSIE